MVGWATPESTPALEPPPPPPQKLSDAEQKRLPRASESSGIVQDRRNCHQSGAVNQAVHGSSGKEQKKSEKKERERGKKRRSRICQVQELNEAPSRC